MNKHRLTNLVSEAIESVYNNERGEQYDDIAEVNREEEENPLEDPINHSVQENKKQIIRITEEDLSKMIMRYAKKLMENVDGFKDLQRYDCPYEGNGGTLYLRKKGYSPKMSRHTYPAKTGLETCYGKIDVDNEYAPSKNKMHMQQHRNGEYDLNKSINSKYRAGSPVSNF